MTKKKYATLDEKRRAKAYYQHKSKKKGEALSEEEYNKQYRPAVFGRAKTREGEVLMETHNRIQTKTQMTIVDGRVQVSLIPVSERRCTICKQWVSLALISKSQHKGTSEKSYRCNPCLNQRRKNKAMENAETDDAIDREAAKQATCPNYVAAKMESWNLHKKKFGYVSALTGIPFRVDDDKYKPSPDRIVPAVQGGKYTVDNIRWVLRAENLMRKAYSDEFFDEVCRGRVAKLDAEQPGSSAQHALA